MPCRLLADLVLILHAAFVVFVVLGALLALRWPRVAWVHVPVALVVVVNLAIYALVLRRNRQSVH